MGRKIVVWDVDDVIVKGRGTTWLAKGRKGNPEEMIKLILSWAGRGPLHDIKREDLEEGFKRWQDDNGKIMTLHDLAKCLTDLRHVYKVLPEARHTKFTKNLILKGMTDEEIKAIAEDEDIYVPEALEVIKALNALGDVYFQIVFSDGIAPFVYHVAKRLGIAYGKATPTYVIFNGEEIFYSEGMKDYELAGRVEEGWKKLEEIKRFLESSEADKAIAIDDNKPEMLAELKNIGVEVYLYYNEEIHPKNKKYADKAVKLGIPVVESLHGIKILKEV